MSGLLRTPGMNLNHSCSLPAIPARLAAEASNAGPLICVECAKEWVYIEQSVHPDGGYWQQAVPGVFTIHEEDDVTIPPTLPPP